MCYKRAVAQGCSQGSAFGTAAVGAPSFGGTPGGFCSPAQLAVYCCGVMERGEADKGDTRNCAGGFALFLGGQPLCNRCSFHMASVFERVCVDLFSVSKLKKT